MRTPCSLSPSGTEGPSTRIDCPHRRAFHIQRMADTAAYKTTCDGNKDCGPLFCHPEGVSLPSLCPYGLRYARGLNPVSVTETSQPFVFGFTRTAVRTPHAKAYPPRRTGEMAATDYHVGVVTVPPVPTRWPQTSITERTITSSRGGETTPSLSHCLFIAWVPAQAPNHHY